jgi:hypothetical protein
MRYPQQRGWADLPQFPASGVSTEQHGCGGGLCRRACCRLRAPGRGHVQATSTRACSREERAGRARFFPNNKVNQKAHICVDIDCYGEGTDVRLYGREHREAAMRWIAVVVLVLTAAAATAGPAAAQTGERCFAETGYCISGPIRAYWERNGGLAVFGYPKGPQTIESVEGVALTVQWFERDRLEIQRDGRVTAGRLGALRLEQIGTPWQFGPRSAAGAGCLAFAETGYQICGAFAQYWQRNGGLERFGYPISGEYIDTVEGKQDRVQWFERRRFEWHPEIGNGTVLLGLLGNEVRAAAAAPAAAPAPAPAPAPTAAPVSNEPIRLRGKGSQGLTDVTTPWGLNRVTVVHDGMRYVGVKAYDTTGDYELLMNEVGSHTASVLLANDAGSPLMIEIKADGNWWITFEPIGINDGSMYLNGRGPVASEVFRTGGRTAEVYQMTHDGRSNFIVWLHCDEGSDLAVNEIGSFNQRVVVEIEGDACLWDVDADGTWSLVPVDW